MYTIIFVLRITIYFFVKLLHINSLKKSIVIHFYNYNTHILILYTIFVYISECNISIIIPCVYYSLNLYHIITHHNGLAHFNDFVAIETVVC
jgi:hypothetical protein